MSFQSQRTSDIAAVLNVGEFAQTITIGGVSVAAIVQVNDLTPEFSADAFQGRVYVAVSSLSLPPVYRTPVVIDGVTWYVFKDRLDRDYYIEGDMYVISIYRGERPKVF
jgi:hypothetical protein